jgi:hypothetical protein
MQIDGGQGVQLKEKSAVSRAAADAKSDTDRATDDDGHGAAGGGDEQQTGSGPAAGSSEGRHVLVDALLLLTRDGTDRRRQPEGGIIMKMVARVTKESMKQCNYFKDKNTIEPVYLFVCLPLSVLY